MSENEKENKLQALRNKYKVQPNNLPLDEDELGMGDVLRLLGSGFLFGFADEIEAGTKSIFSDASYAEELKKAQAKLEEARAKDDYSLIEMGGAMLPAIAAAPFTGGASVPVTMARLAGVGAGQGAITALGEGKEANLVDRVIADPYAMPTGAAIGGGGSLIGGQLFKGGANLLSKLVDKPVRTLNKETGKRVEDEIIRVMNSQQMPLEEVIAGIKSGKILPEISNEFADYVSVLGAKGEDAGAFLKKRIRDRTSKKVKEVYTSAQKDLAPDVEAGNVVTYFNKTIDDVKREENKAYKKLFTTTKDMDLPEAGAKLLDIVDGRGDLYKILNKHISLAVQSKGNKAPLFEMGEDEILKIGRNVNPEVLEEVRKKLAGLSDAAFKSSDSTLAGAGSVYKSLEQAVRQLSDNSNNTIKGIRSNYSKIYKAKEAYEFGEKAFNSKSFDDFEDRFKKFIQANPDQIDNLRLGVIAKLRANFGKPTKARSFIKSLNNPDSQDRKILEEIYPNETIESIANKIDIAESAKIAERATQKITTTADKLLKAEKIGKKVSQQDVANVLSIPVTGVPSPGIMGSIKKIFRAFIPDSNISEAEMLQIARILVSEDADAVRKALTDREVRNALVRRANQIINTLTKSVGTATGTESVKQAGSKNFSIVSNAIAEEIDPEDYRFIEQLSSNLSPSAKEKIMRITIDSGNIVDDQGNFIRRFGPEAR
jgi:hypothetical protein